MKNLLLPKTNRLLIKFKETKDLPQRIESFRTTSVEKAQKIINKRNKQNILFASFGVSTGLSVMQTDSKLILSKRIAL